MAIRAVGVRPFGSYGRGAGTISCASVLEDRPMRLLIAMMKHETNTFSPVPTPLARFADGAGAAGRRGGGRARIAGTGIGARRLLELAERERRRGRAADRRRRAAERPGRGRRLRAHRRRDLRCGGRGGFDGILLDLHGAMVTESHEDGEGELLRRMRAIAPTTPIAVALDMHANLYDAIIANATVIDRLPDLPACRHLRDRERAPATILLRAIRGEVRPVMAWGNVPMLPHVMRQGTDDHPNQELQARCARDGEPRARSPRACSSASRTPTSGMPGCRRWSSPTATQTLAERPARRAARPRLGRRARTFVYSSSRWQHRSPAPRRCRRRTGRAADRAARPLRQLRLGRHDGHDGGARRESSRRAGQCRGVRDLRPGGRAADDRRRHRREVTLSLGGKLDMPAIPGRGPPLTVTGMVKTISDGRYRNSGPMARGVLNDMGPTVVLDTGKVEIVLISRHVEPHDLAASPPRHRPEQKRYVMLKSRIHWRAGLGRSRRRSSNAPASASAPRTTRQLNFKQGAPADLPARPAEPLIRVKPNYGLDPAGMVFTPVSSISKAIRSAPTTSGP